MIFIYSYHFSPFPQKRLILRLRQDVCRPWKMGKGLKRLTSNWYQLNLLKCNPKKYQFSFCAPVKINSPRDTLHKTFCVRCLLVNLFSDQLTSSSTKVTTLTTYFVFIFIFVVLNCFLPLTRFTMLTFSFFDNSFTCFYNRNAAR